MIARVIALILGLTAFAHAQAWTDRVRGSWVADVNDKDGVGLVGNDVVCDIVVAPDEPSCVQQAAKFLAGDIEKISGHRPQIVAKSSNDRPAIVLATSKNDPRWEAYRIRTVDRTVELTGSNPRGTAFAAYTLAERLGVDPLYHWTGYEPDHHDPLIVKPIDFSADEPTFKYRGMLCAVPAEWYARYVETALRLRMNMVDPPTIPPGAAPAESIIVWPDDNDGVMRALPEKPGRWKHGVYYHLACLDKQVKLNAHMVHPSKVAAQFRRIVDAGATQYMLVDVAQLREFIMEARMIAEICWDAKTALSGDDAAQRYVDWWCREYFGDAAEQAAVAYEGYQTAFDTYDKAWFGSDRLHESLAHKRSAADVSERADLLRRANAAAEAAITKMTRPQGQFFFEHVQFPILCDLLPLKAAIAMEDHSDAHALADVEQLELAILRAERPPFENWYRETFVRRGPEPNNLHRPYRELRLYITTDGKRFELDDPRSSTTTTTTTSSTR